MSRIGRLPWEGLLVLLLLLAGTGWGSVQAAPDPEADRAPAALEGVGVVERLGKKVDRSLAFTDHNGRSVRLGDYFGDDRPVLLTLNYYRCRMLCNLQLNALLEGLRGLEWTAGEGYRIVTVSIDPRETASLAREKRANYLRAYGRGESADWSFLVGSEASVAALAEAVGFRYRYEPETDQFGHTAAIFFLSPDGTVSRYLYGLEYPARDVKFALMDASQGRVGSTVDRILLSCFHYDAAIGDYGPFAWGLMRAAGVLTVVGLAFTLAVLWRRDRFGRRAEVSAT